MLDIVNEAVERVDVDFANGRRHAMTLAPYPHMALSRVDGALIGTGVQLTEYNVDVHLTAEDITGLPAELDDIDGGTVIWDEDPPYSDHPLILGTENDAEPWSPPRQAPRWEEPPDVESPGWDGHSFG